MSEKTRADIYDGRMGRYRIEQPRWMRTLKVGDVITNGGAWRVVRSLSRRIDGRLYSVAVVIRRCSWTHRCYTILNATDLRMFGYRKVPVRAWKCRTDIDKAITKAIREPSWEKSLTCCDVEGLS